MSENLTLQVGGTLNPRKHIYIQRPEDEQLLSLLVQGQFCNVLAPRQMGKSSLMAQTVYSLRDAGIGTVSIDLAGDLGTPEEPQDWYLDLAKKVARDLDLGLNVEGWWHDQPERTTSRRLMRFFGFELPQRVASPIVIFLDEIDSTLRLPYADDLFLSIRTLNNDRALEPSYERITFCLLGVATPNELIKRQEATAYNVGQTLELRDFDEDRDDLSLLRRYLSRDSATGQSLLRRVLYWTGGQPYLTTKLCKQLVDAGVTAASGVDEFTHKMLLDWEKLGSDVHFQQVERFIGTRVSDKAATLSLYEKIRSRELDSNTQAHIELRLSGLVKRGEDGSLVVRNRIYERIFDLEWVRENKPAEPLEKRQEGSAFEEVTLKEFLRKFRRVTYPAYAIVTVLLIAVLLLTFRTVTLSQKYRELVTPRNLSLQSLSFPGATRGTSTVEPIVVPAGREVFGVELEVAESAIPFLSYRIELWNQGGEMIWRGENLALDPDGMIRIVFPRSFLPAGNYKALLYGVPADGKVGLVAEYPMPIQYEK